MEMHDAKRVEIMIEAPLERRLTDALHAAEVTGFTVLPVLGVGHATDKWAVRAWSR